LCSFLIHAFSLRARLFNAGSLFRPNNTNAAIDIPAKSAFVSKARFILETKLPLLLPLTGQHRQKQSFLTQINSCALLLASGNWSVQAREAGRKDNKRFSSALSLPAFVHTAVLVVAGNQVCEANTIL
jgi:hypothetical protein